MMHRFVSGRHGSRLLRMAPPRRFTGGISVTNFDKRLGSTTDASSDAPIGHHHHQDDTTTTSSSDNTKSSMESHRTLVLESALKQVHQHGWTEDAIAAGMVASKLPLSMTGMVSIHDLVSHVMECGNLCLEKTLQNKKLSNDNDKSQRLAECLRIRLEYNLPFVETSRWHEAMAVGAQNAAVTTRQLNEMMDIVERSVPLTGPLERTAVGAIYAATELHLLVDKSEGYQDTWDFLQERLRELELASNVTSTSTIMSGDAAVAASAVAFSLGGAVLSLAQPAARGAVAAVASTVVPQIATFMQAPSGNDKAGTRPSDYNAENNNELPPFPTPTRDARGTSTKQA